jgi:hypothetical protein
MLLPSCDEAEGEKGSFIVLFEKVFGIGWAKTGTATLGARLTSLDFRHCASDWSCLNICSLII